MSIISLEHVLGAGGGGMGGGGGHYIAIVKDPNSNKNGINGLTLYDAFLGIINPW